MTSEPQTPPPEKGSWQGGALVASVSAVLLVFVLLHFSENTAKPLPLVANPGAPSAPSPMMDLAKAAASTALAPAPPTSAAPLSAIPSASMVEVFILSTPMGAAISHDGQPLGFSPGPITLPSNPEKATLTVAAAGYVSQELVVTPAPGKTFKVTLKKAPPAPRRPSPRADDGPKLE